MKINKYMMIIKITTIILCFNFLFFLFFLFMGGTAMAFE